MRGSYFTLKSAEISNKKNYNLFFHYFLYLDFGVKCALDVFKYEADIIENLHSIMNE